MKLTTYPHLELSVEWAELYLHYHIHLHGMQKDNFAFEIEQEDLCSVSISSSKLYRNALSNFSYAVHVLFSFDIFLCYNLPNSPI